MGSSSGRYPAATEDRLSSLPDGLLHTIMSFLRVRQAVQTCVLSRRWEKLWCSMPCLDIDQQDFHAATSRATSDHNIIRGSGRFEEFVNSLLMFYNAPQLDRFRFHVTGTYEYKVVSRWLRRGMRCCPVVVEVCSSPDTHRFYELPDLGSSACCLKRLYLVDIALNKSFAQQLPSCCPVLEDLKLEKCLLHSPEISSCTIKNLIITDCTTSFGNVLTITAPTLFSFRLTITIVGLNWKGILVNDMPSLVKASVCLKSRGGTASSLQERPSKLLCSLVNVKYLQLSGPETLSLLHDGSNVFPTFDNLKTLQFDGCDLSDNFQILQCFLNNAFTLERLGMQYCKLPAGPKKRKRTENPKRISINCENTLIFWCPNLKLTEIKYKEDDVHQLFGLLSGIWRNLRETTIKLMKA